MMYIVRFTNGGYALMTADKDFGVEILHVQTGGEITKDEATTPSQAPPSGNLPTGKPDLLPTHPWAELAVAQFRAQYGWKEAEIIEWGSLWRFKHGPGGNGGTIVIEHLWMEYETYQVYEVPTSFWVTAGYPLNKYGALGTLAPAVLEFLGYHEDVNTFLGHTGVWSAIKSWHGNYPAPEWTWAIQNYCCVTINGQMYVRLSSLTDFLQNECSGKYPNAHFVQLAHSDNAQSSGAISALIANNKPVIVQFGGTTGLAYKEELQQNLEYKHIDGTPTTPTGNVKYSSIIHYKVSLQDKVESFKTERHVLNSAFYYIAY